MPCLADRMAFLVESDILRGIFGGCCPAVEINQRIHIPAFQHFISRNVVMGGIEADKFWGKTQEIAPEIVSCEEEIFAVMAFGIGKLHEEREIDLKDIEIASTMIHDAASEEVNLMWGVVFDENMEDEIRVTMIATDFEEKPELTAADISSPQPATIRSEERRVGKECRL